MDFIFVISVVELVMFTMLTFCIILVKCTSGGAKPAKNTNVATLIAICKEMVRDQEKWT